MCIMDENRMLKNVFLKDYYEKGHWSFVIAKILEEVNMRHIYDNCNPCNIKECKDLLESNYECEWEQLVNRKPKLRSYILWKDGFGPATYVKYNLTRSQRSILAQLWSGTLPLKIEPVRFTRVDINDRL